MEIYPPSPFTLFNSSQKRSEADLTGVAPADSTGVKFMPMKSIAHFSGVPIRKNIVKTLAALACPVAPADGTGVPINRVIEYLNQLKRR